MTTHAPSRIEAFIDARPFTAFQRTLLILCFLVVAIDGFDTAAIGFLAPAIRAEWHVAAAAMAPLFGAGLFGLMTGALVFGPLADRFGRKTLLVATTAFFGLASLASMLAPDLQALVVLRFLTGLGLGGAMPNAITLTSEYCPRQRRSGLVTLMFCGFTIGSALGGLASAQLLPVVGWRGVLALGGILPLLLVPVLALRLPESLRFLVARQRPQAQVLAIARRLDPALPDSHRFVPDAASAASPVRELFRGGMLGGTLLLWATFFASLLIVYLVSSWTPTLLANIGVPLQRAALVTTMFQVGGTVGAIALGRLMDRFDPYRVLGLSYLCAAGFILLCATSAASTGMLAAAIFGVGFCVSGSQVGVNALSAAYYPTSSRATGVSWSNAVGRCGSVLGSMAGGSMLAMNLGFQAIFSSLAVPAVIAAAALTLMGVLSRRRARAGGLAPAGAER
ncbi:4-hydroxybenzoate transporter [Cupriavidus sp. USMAA2-4]|uniref:4-hydroxybenzoate transporter n=1 Tax=Cupriavidus malaysiensis TaxID=367825 RepID=A0ABM6F3N7_9BURK|nr:MULTISPECIES: aromatic acid/H+ symport family MFS transporter [Cupriavidus]AOY91011.1 4-hydroxybenzoate transporter [Cupriavidus sp. USMAA2-4]AOZ06033.1 4-hydroxybenzoate transporter [Cupriavidus malaysiensis]